MQCPRCGEPLSTAFKGLFDDIETHTCKGCGGSFYPPGSLDRLDDSITVNVEELPLRDRASEVALRCFAGHAVGEIGYRSAARATLTARALGAGPSVGLWQCDSCGGFWLEGDALERLRALALAESERENRKLNGLAERRHLADEERKKEKQSRRPPPG